MLDKNFSHWQELTCKDIEQEFVNKGFFNKEGVLVSLERAVDW